MPNIAKIELFDSNREWLRSLTKFNGDRVFSDRKINSMTDAEVDRATANIMHE